MGSVPPATLNCPCASERPALSPTVTVTPASGLLGVPATTVPARSASWAWAAGRRERTAATAARSDFIVSSFRCRQLRWHQELLEAGAAVGVGDDGARQRHDILGPRDRATVDRERRDIARRLGPAHQFGVVDAEGPGQQVDLAAQFLFEDGLRFHQLLLGELLIGRRRQTLFLDLEVGMPEGMPLDVDQA